MKSLQRLNRLSLRAFFKRVTYQRGMVFALAAIIMGLALFQACQSTDSSEPITPFQIDNPDSSLLDYTRLRISLEHAGKDEPLFDGAVKNLEQFKSMKASTYVRGQAAVLHLRGWIGDQLVYEETRNFDGTAFAAAVILKRPGKGLHLDPGLLFQIPLGQAMAIPFVAAQDEDFPVTKIRWSLDRKATWSEKTGNWAGLNLDFVTDILGPWTRDEDAVIDLEVYATPHIKASGQRRLRIGAGSLGSNLPPQISILVPERGGLAGSPLHFSVLAEDKDGRLATFAWDFDGDGKIDSTGLLSAAKTEVIGQFQYASRGRYRVTVHVTDNRGDEALDSFWVNVIAPEAALKDLKIVEGNLKTIFDPGTTHYESVVSATTENATITLTPNADGAVVTVVDAAGKAVDASKPVPLQTGDNVFTITVTQGTASETYTLNIIRSKADASGVNTLATLKLDGAVLKTVLTEGVTDYEADAKKETSSVLLHVAATDIEANVVLDSSRNMKAAGDSAVVALRGDKTAILIAVTAQNGVVNKYRITVNRDTTTTIITPIVSDTNTLDSLKVAGTTFAFDKTKDAFSVSLPNATASTTVTGWLTDAKATMTLDGKAATSGQAIAIADLVALQNRVVKVVVTAANKSVRTYTLTLQRQGSGNADLKSLVANPGNTTVTLGAGNVYALSVANTVTQITLTLDVQDPTSKAYLLPDSTLALTPGTASKSVDLVEAAVTALAVRVVAQDGSRRNYTFNVTRAASAESRLKTLAVTPTGRLSKNFAPDTLSGYIISLNTTESAVTFVATTMHANAKMLLNGVALGQNESRSVTISVTGDTPVNLEVTAPNGVAKTTYAFVVRRAKNSTAALAGLSATTPCNLGTFNAAGTNYSCTVSSTAAAPTVTATLNTGTTLAITGGVVTGNTTKLSPAIGASATATFVVTAEDGVTKNTVQVTVNRQNNVSTLDSLRSNGSGLSVATTTLAQTVAFATTTASLYGFPKDAKAIMAYKLSTATTWITLPPKTNSTAITLGAAGTATAIQVQVTAEDPAIVTTYTLTVTRQAGNTSTDLTVTSSNAACVVAPTGSQASAYTCTMVTGSAAATITGTAAATSRVSVDGGAASTNTAQKSLNPTPGTSVATRFTVTSESGVSRTVDVTLSEADDNTLSKLSIPGCSVNLTGSIAATITCAAPFGTTSVTLSATATSTASKLSVNSGASSASNTISSVLTTGTAGAPASRHTVLVQPSIGATRTYVINISRQAPDTRTDVDYVTYSWPGGSVQVPQETGTQMGNFFGRIPAGISSITVTPHTVSPVATVSNLTSPISISMHGASGQGSMNVTSESGAVQTFYIEPYREFSNLKSLLVSDGWIVSAANAAKAFTEDDYEYILYVQTDDQASVNLTFGAINPGAQIVIYTATSSGTIIGAPNQTLTIPVPPFVDSELYIHIAEGGGSTVYHFAIRL